MMKEKTYVEDINRSIYDFRNEDKDNFKIAAGLTPELVSQISKERMILHGCRISDYRHYKYIIRWKFRHGVRP